MSRIRAWVPTAVADCARLLRPQKILMPTPFEKRLLTVPPFTDPSRTILIRLLTDPRMRSVWAELTRKERRTGRFLHPSRLEHFAEASERQDRTMGVLIHLVLYPYGHGVRPTARLRHDVDKDRAEAREMACKLREWAAREGAVERYNM